MRLIDADELRKQMYHQAFETDTDMQICRDGIAVVGFGTRCLKMP